MALFTKYWISSHYNVSPYDRRWIFDDAGAGNEASAQTRPKQGSFTYSLIGFLLVVSSYFILQIIVLFWELILLAQNHFYDISIWHNYKPF